MARPLRAWVLGDSGLPGVNADDVRDAYTDASAGMDTDLWLMLGDNAYNAGADEEFQDAMFGTYSEFLKAHATWSTAGNHDVLGVYYDVFTLPQAGEAGGVPSGSEKYYSFDVANVHFVCLDSEESSTRPTGSMARWLDLDLADTNQEWIIAFWHRPPYSKGTHNSDSEARMVDMRTDMVPILENSGVDLVLTGHSHNYERSFLIDGHYGFSASFDPSVHLIDGGSGEPSVDGPYVKPSGGPTLRAGAATWWPAARAAGNRACRSITRPCSTRRSGWDP